MYAVSASFLDALRVGGGAWYGYVEAWRGGSRVTLEDGSWRLPLRTDGQNQIQVDGSTPGVRRTLSLTLAPQVGLWEALAPIGTELHAYTAIRYPSGAVEVVPQGVFDVDVQALDYTSAGDLTITAPDRWQRVANARFFTPRSFASGTGVVSLVSSLLTAAVPGVTPSIVSTSTVALPAEQTEDKDRAALIQRVLTAASLDCYFDRNGIPVIRDTPTIQSTPVWTVDAGSNGVLLGADRTRDRQRTYNIIVVTGERNDGTAPFAPQFVWDNNPASPTYAGSGTGAGSSPPSSATAGPFGQRPRFFNSPLLKDAAQAQTAGRTLLAKVTGLNAQLGLSAVPNTALDDGDTVSVILPRERWDRPQQSERHIVDSMTVPLVWHRQPLQLSTRSTVADIQET